MSGNSSIQFNYQSVAAVRNQVAIVGEEVQELFRRIDQAIQENVGEGTEFKGQTATAFKASWEQAKLSFKDYTQTIDDICKSALDTEGTLRQTENAGASNVTQL